jgi:hypothetical protein
MTHREGYWIGGLAIGIVVAALTPVSELRWLLGGLAWVVIGLLGELVGALRTPKRPSYAEHARPADGVVGIQPVRGVLGTPNTIDPRFRRFENLEPPGSESKAPPRASAGFPPLLGDVVIFSLFLGRDGQAWSDAEIAQALRALIRAGTWLEKQAIRWGAPVNLHVAETYFQAEDPAGSSEGDVEIESYQRGQEFELDDAQAGLKVVVAASRAAARLGFADASALTSILGERVDGDVRVWLVHVRSGGRSRAVPEVDSGLPGVNLAVCHARETDFPEPLSGAPFSDPVTFVHELLHLFGAQDKYGYPLHTYSLGSVSERDIMRLDANVLSRLRIDPATAREIGWEVSDKALVSPTKKNRRDV